METSRVHFVFPGRDRWSAVLGDREPAAVDRHASRFVLGAEAWTMQTYLRLRAAGRDVDLVEEFVPGAICVAHYDHIPLRRWPRESFVVGIQADRPRLAACDVRVVQNRGSAPGRRTRFLPHWPQPGLIERTPDRGTRLERIVYFGRAGNLAPRYRSGDFRRRLAEMDVELEIREGDWTDYGAADAVLAVRDLPDFVLRTKPATKLVNAWLAGCVALLGREPAYEELRRDELDYETIESPEDVLRVVARLRAEPERYRAMVEHGRRRAREFDVAAVTSAWTSFLEGEVTERYRIWKRRSLVGAGWRAARHATRVARQKLARESFERRVVRAGIQAPHRDGSSGR